MSRLSHLWARHRLLLIAFVVVAAATLLFAVRTVSSTLYWMDPAHQDQPIKGWMTPHYVAVSYHLPREVVAAALSLGQDAPKQRLNLEQIAAQNHLTLTELQQRIDAAAEVYRRTTP